MKYWCYYTDVVRYLERLEALYSQKKAEGPAYLIWQDDDGPSMIAGPGIDWHRGDGPPPDIDAITLRAGRPPVPPRRTPLNRKTQNRARQRNTTKPQCRQRAGSATAPDVAHGSAVPPRACGAWSGENHSTVLEDLPLDRIASVLAFRWTASRPLARHNPAPPSHQAPARPKRRTKGVRIFQNPLKPAHISPRNSRGVDGSPRSTPQITSHPSSPRRRRPQQPPPAIESN